jgi:arabinan endo-1,5-alpha-L-arabinosidase
VAYNTRVARSHTPDGNFAGINGVYPILTHPYKFNDHSGWVGISHCTVFQNDNGDWFYCSQARLPENAGGNPHSNAIMMGHVRKIRFTDDGWPVVMPERYSAVPDVTIADDELTGSWEIIRLRYQYQAQQTSQTLTLNGDKTATGALSGNWSWNAATKTLTVGSQKLYLERETDWEANPRKHTIVFAGLNANGESLWGKKNQ